jgi:hypothetical protein
MLGTLAYSPSNSNIEYRLNTKFMRTEAHMCINKHFNGNGDSCGQRHRCLQIHLPAELVLPKTTFLNLWSAMMGQVVRKQT